MLHFTTQTQAVPPQQMKQPKKVVVIDSKRTTPHYACYLNGVYICLTRLTLFPEASKTAKKK